MSTFSAGDYTATITDDNYVIVTFNGVIIDRPGPWADQESAAVWAETIVGKWSITGHEIDMDGEG